MRTATIVAPLRTAVGRFLGTLQNLPAEDLASTVIKAVLQRTGLDPARIDDVIFAQSYANSEAPCIGRWAALAAGLPLKVPGAQVDRRCGGGVLSIATAAMMVQTGTADVVLAGGVESMSNMNITRPACAKARVPVMSISTTGWSVGGSARSQWNASV